MDENSRLCVFEICLYSSVVQNSNVWSRIGLTYFHYSYLKLFVVNSIFLYKIKKHSIIKFKNHQLGKLQIEWLGTPKWQLKVISSKTNLVFGQP